MDRYAPTQRMTSAEAAERMGITEGTLRVWRARGRGPVFSRFAGRIFYRKADVDAWVEQETTFHGRA